MASLSKSVKNSTKALNKGVKNIFSNKYFLYLTLFLAITSVLGYLQLQNYKAVVFFILVGFLTYYFTKNMSIVLLTAILATALYSNMQKKLVEGLENKKEEMEDDDDDEEGMEDEDDEAEEEGMKSGSGRVDYEKTLTDSYKNLNSMIGNEGMQRMTKDTERLMNTQKQLAKNMENMKPMLENAQSMIAGMKGMDLKGLGKMMNQLGGLGAMRGGNTGSS